MTTIDLDTLMGTLESSSRIRNGPPRVMGKKCPLCDDEELLITKDRLCRTCGEELIEITEAITAMTSNGHDRGESVDFFDLLGIYIYIYVYIYVYIYMYIYMYIYIKYVCMKQFMYIYKYKYVCMK
jgi:hypothetical protein